MKTWKRRIAMAVALCLLLPSFALADSGTPWPVAERGGMKAVIRLPHGTGESAVGYAPASHGGKEATGIVSFEVHEGVFFLLDNVQNNIAIVENGAITKKIALPDDDYRDLRLSGQGTFFVLTGTKVLEVDEAGTVVREKELASSIAARFRAFGQDRLLLITDIGWLEGDPARNDPAGIPARMDGDGDGDDAFSAAPIRNDREEPGLHALWDGTQEERYRLSVYTIPHKNGGRIVHVDGNTRTETPYYYRIGEGGLEVLDMRDNAYLVEKTELSPDTSRILSETHLTWIDREGRERGWFRIPTEQMAVIPNIFARTDNGHIYLLLVTENDTAVYECTLGQERVSTLAERIKDVLDVERSEAVDLWQRVRGPFRFGHECTMRLLGNAWVAFLPYI